MRIPGIGLRQYAVLLEAAGVDFASRLARPSAGQEPRDHVSRRSPRRNQAFVRRVPGV